MILRTLPTTCRWHLFKIQGQLDLATAPAVAAALAHAANLDRSDLLVDLEDLDAADEIGAVKLCEAVRRLLAEHPVLQIAFVVRDTKLAATLRRTKFLKLVAVFGSGEEALAAIGLHAAA